MGEKDIQGKRLGPLQIYNLDRLQDKDKIMGTVLDQEIMAYASDQNETSFVEERRGVLTLVFQLLDLDSKHLQKDKLLKVTPMTFVLADDILFILTNNRTEGLLEEVLDSLDLDKTARHILYQLLTLFTKDYFQLMEDISQKREELIVDLRKRPNKENLKELANLQSGSVHILMGAEQNSDVLADIKDLPSHRSSDEEEKEQLRDTIIEVKQLSNMCTLHARILEQLASSYNNVLSNNLNDNVTTLTIVSIGLSMLATVTSFYGMNVKLPFAKVDSIWIWVLIVTGMVAIICIFIMRSFVKREHDD
ncbi:magnesium transporter CorA family protein [Streptococcus catagoni]|uniref:magnesium transporter CorA family protein n=1 Tax=Streptococcus catagoni TaxID=2654874 RepID=UPI00140C3EB3|nr:magnesium transporter CorA family protein [Streptococcus catagoni]